MDYLKQIQFYADGKVISPRNLQCDFNNKSLTYNIELESDYLDKKDASFFFTAKFATHVICDIKLQEKKLSVTCNPSDLSSHNILFDGFSYTDNTGVEKTKSIFLKSLEKIKELINDTNQIKRAEEQKPVIHVNVFKCQFPKAHRRASEEDGNDTPCAGVSKALFVEALQLNSAKKIAFDFVREKKIMELKINFNTKIVEEAEDQTICVI